jgi:hypothetical protein
LYSGEYNYIYSVTGGTFYIEYALCSSNANSDLYIDAIGPVNDPYKIVGGTTSIKESTNVLNFSFDAYTLKSSTTYYLYLWSARVNTASTMNSISFYTNTSETYNKITISHAEGNPVYIDDGTKMVSYQCYIDNGSSWDSYAPYIDDGTKWVAYG